MIDYLFHPVGSRLATCIPVLAGVLVLVHSNAGAQSASGTVGDITQPGDKIVTDFAILNTPFPQDVFLIDNDPGTGFRNFITDCSFTITPAAGPSIVTALSLTSAADAPERDPAEFKLEGSQEGTNFVLIAEGPVPPFSGRSMRQEIEFQNTNSFRIYRLSILTDPQTADSIQLAELELLGTTSNTPAPRITVTREGSSVRLTYEGILESAERVDGPYTVLQGATSPHTVSATEPAHFYRVR